MSNMKKILSLLLCFGMLFSMLPTAFAEGDQEETTEEVPVVFVEEEALVEGENVDPEPVADPQPSHVCEYTAVVTEPTCTEQGYTTYTCDCGNSYVDDYTDALGHTEEAVAEIPAEVGQPGKTAGTVCPVCGIVLSGCEEIPALLEPEPEEPAVETVITIEKQPEDLKPVDGTGKFTVTSSVNTEAALSYRWQRLDETVTYKDEPEREAAWEDIEGKDAFELELTGLEDEAALAEAMKYAYRCMIRAGEVSVLTKEVHVLEPDPVEQPPEEETVETEAADEGDIKASGTCGAYGSDLTWTLYTNGDMVIAGTGEMKEYGYASFPWENYRYYIKTLQVQEGVTYVSEYAFENCSQLESVTLANTVTTLREDSFKNCNKISHLVVPASVTNMWYALDLWQNAALTSAGPIGSGCGYEFGWTDSIPDGAFCKCRSLQTVTLPQTITSIGKDAFYECRGLTEIVLPSSVVSLGESAFSWSVNLTSVTFPASLKTIGVSAFQHCIMLDHVQLPDGVETIGEYAFNYCTALTEVTIPYTMVSIGNLAFYDCSALETVYYQGTEAEWNRIDNHGGFQNATIIFHEHTWGNPTYVWAEDNSTVTASRVCAENTSHVETETVEPVLTVTTEPTYESVGAGYYTATFTNLAFEPQTLEVEIPQLVPQVIASGNCGAQGNNLTWAMYDTGTLLISGSGAMANFSPSAAPWSAFSGILNRVILEDGVTNIGRYAFYECSALTTAEIPTGVTSIGNYAFADSGLTSVELPAGVGNIGSYAFYNCTAMTAVGIPEGVTSIGNYAFAGCSALQSLTIPGSLTNIGNFVFCSCSGLRNLVIRSGVKSIGQSAFDGCSSLTDVEIQSGLTIIGQSAFAGCSSLTALDLPSGLTSISADAFSNCSRLTRITIPSSVTNMGSSVFAGCGGLAFAGPGDDDCNIAFGWTDTIPDNAFSDSALMSVRLPEGLMNIGKNAFGGCSALRSVVLPDGLTGIGDNAFENCSGLTNMVLPASLTSIGSSAFNGCSGLTSAGWIGSGCNIEFGWTDAIPANIFSNCSNLQIVRIPSGMTGIGSYAFAACYGLTSVMIPEGLTTIGDHAFALCSSLTSIEVPASVTDIGEYTFQGCTGLTSAGPIGGGFDYEFGWTESIPACAFSGCSELMSAAIPSTVTSIGNHAFQNCSTLSGLILPAALTEIGDYAFNSCSGFMEITLPANVTSVGDYAFYNCSELTSIEIPAALTEIGSNAFYGCNALDAVHIHDLDAWTGISFAGSASNPLACAHKLYLNDRLVTEVEFPEGMTSIRPYVFYNAGCLTDITIPESVARIETGAFNGCSGLTVIAIPVSVTVIEDSAFNECSGLTDVYYGSTEIRWNATVAVGPYNDSLTSAAMHYSEPAHAVFASGECGAQGDNLIWTLDDAGILTVSGTGDMADFDYAGGPWSRYGIYLREVVIENGVTSIGTHAFYGNTGSADFSVVRIPASLADIASWAFYSCSSLTDVYYDSTEIRWNRINISNMNNSLVSATIHFAEPTHEIIASGECGAEGDNLTWTLDDTGILIISGTGAMADYSYRGAPWYSYCSDIAKVIVETGAASIGSYAFYNCSGLTSVELPDSLIRIGERGFYACAGLTGIGIPEGVTTLGPCAFYACAGLTSVRIPSGVANIGNQVFAGCSGLTSAGPIGSGSSIEFGWTDSIPEKAFSDCSSLESVIIPKTLTSIGVSAFVDCSGLSDVYYESTEFCWDLINIAVNNTDLTSATIHFEEPTHAVVDSGECGAQGNNLTWTMDDAGILTISGTGAMADFNAYSAPWYSYRHSMFEVVFESGMINIGNYAFYDCERLKSLVIPEGVTGIGHSAFASCRDLENVTFPSGLMIIGNSAFNDSAALKDVEIPYGVTLIDDLAFASCSDMNTVRFRCSAPSISNNAFWDVTATACYPENDPTWTEESFQDYNGTLTWTPYELYSEPTWSWNEDHTAAAAVSVCSLDGEAYSKDAGISTVVQEPTCEEDGEKTVTAVVSFESVVFTKTLNFELPATGHAWGEAQYSWLEGNSVVVAERICGHDSSHMETETVETTAVSRIDGVNLITTYTAEFANPAFETQTKEVTVELAINKTELSLNVNQTETLQVTDGNGNAVIVAWESTNPAIATVSAEGLVKALKSGTTRISALNEQGNEIAGCAVTVVFTDVADPSRYFYEPVYWALENNITTGAGGPGLFSPNNDCTREQIVTFLWRLMGEPEPSYYTPFTDVPQNAWYYKPISWAAEMGITVGLNDGTGRFGVGQACTRAMCVTFLWRAAGKPAPATQGHFTDMKPGAYYVDAVSWAAENNITVGLNDGTGRFGINNSCTRAMIVTFLYRFAHMS